MEYAYLDDLALPLIGVDTLSVKHSYTYATSALIGRKPSLQFTGFGADVVTLTLHYSIFAGVVPEVERGRLMKMASEHEAHYLVFSNADGLGQFVITSVEETYAKTTGDGRLLEWTATVTLQEYVPLEDSASSAAAPAVANSDKAASSQIKQSTNQVTAPKVDGTESAATPASTSKEIVRQPNDE